METTFGIVSIRPNPLLFFFLTGKSKRHHEVPLFLPPATLGRQEGHKADESHAPKPLLYSACTLEASTEPRHTAGTPKPRGKRLRAHSGHVLSAQLHLGATCTAPTRGRAPLLLSPTAALWAKQLRTSHIQPQNEHKTSTSLPSRHCFPPSGVPMLADSPRIEGSRCQPPKKQCLGPARRSLSTIPAGHRQHLGVRSTARSRFGSTVLMRAWFHTPSLPPVPLMSPSLAQDALDTPRPCRGAPIKCSKGRAAPLGMPHTTSFLTWALLAASDSQILSA